MGIVGKIVQGVGREGMDGPEFKVNVRTLDGKSVTVTIANGQTVKNLRDALKESMANASDYQNFHLFLKVLFGRYKSGIFSI